MSTKAQGKPSACHSAIEKYDDNGALGRYHKGHERHRQKCEPESNCPLKDSGDKDDATDSRDGTNRYHIANLIGSTTSILKMKAGP